MRHFRTLALGILLLMFSPAAARADGFLIPFLGVSFAGDSGKEIGEAVDANRLVWGGSLGWMGAGVFGFEGDFGFSPDFFGSSDLGDTKLLTVTANLVVGVPFGGQKGFGIRPYGVVGAGLIKTDLEGVGSSIDDDDNHAGWAAGGGLMMFFGPVGVRGDVRYFRTFDDLEILGIDIAQSPGKVDFTRGSVGLVLRF